MERQESLESDAELEQQDAEAAAARARQEVVIPEASVPPQEAPAPSIPEVSQLRPFPFLPETRRRPSASAEQGAPPHRTISSQGAILRSATKDSQRSTQGTIVNVGEFTRRPTDRLTKNRAQIVEFKTKGNQGGRSIVAELKTKRLIASDGDQQKSANEEQNNRMNRRLQYETSSSYESRRSMTVELKGASSIVAELKTGRRRNDSLTRASASGDLERLYGEGDQEGSNSSEGTRGGVIKRGSSEREQHSLIKRGFAYLEKARDVIESGSTSSSLTRVKVNVDESTPKDKGSRIPTLFFPDHKLFRKTSVKEVTPRHKCLRRTQSVSTPENKGTRIPTFFSPEHKYFRRTSVRDMTPKDKSHRRTHSVPIPMDKIRTTQFSRQTLEHKINPPDIPLEPLRNSGHYTLQEERSPVVSHLEALESELAVNAALTAVSLLILIMLHLMNDSSKEEE
ncbi:hypothetical protein NPIL_320721 [Nephila pilipes]|uniref:Uncharacterized protein n=1 Tax=Nephila pilipes TaxID=299642 RepID=A0A8X6NCA0_NEPPI|nr:hypothetical protein NPIL_320721 [Nephila pilipes]